MCRIFTFNKPSVLNKLSVMVFSFYFRTALLCRFFIFHYFGCCAQCSHSQKNSHQSCYFLTYNLRVKPSLKCRKKTTRQQRFIEVLLTLDVKYVINFFLLFEVDRRIKEINKLISPKLFVFEQKHFLNSHEHFLTHQEP